MPLENRVVAFVAASTYTLVRTSKST